MMNYQNPYMNTNMFPQYIQNPFNNNIYNPQNNVPNISGRFVDSFDSITANDVPMNGQAAVFPKSDLSSLEVRKWSADGTIQRTVYLPVKQVEQIKPRESSNNDAESLESAFKRFTEPLQEQLNRIEKILKPKSTGKKVEDESE